MVEGAGSSGDTDAEKAEEYDISKDGSLSARLRDPERRVELIATILMSIAVVASAYCAWQATRWGGVQAVAFADAAAARVESSKAMARGTQQAAYDASSLLQLLVAYSEGDEEGALKLKEHFLREEFAVYVDEWLAMKPFDNPDAPRTPFDLEDYSNAEIERSERLLEVASKKSDEAKDANQTGDDYILATVYFATVLFFSGVATKFSQRPLQWFVLVLATGGLMFGFYRALALPFH